MHRFALVFVLMAAVGLSLVAGSLEWAAAQDSAGEPVGEVVDPAECTTAPRPVTFLRNLVGTPAAAVTPEPMSEYPEGDQPDEQTAAEVTAAVRQLIACSNSGDLLRGLALYTDDYLRRTLNPSGQLSAEDALSLSQRAATPVAIAEDQLIRLVAIEQMTVDEAGQVALLLITDGGPTDLAGVTVDFFIWKESGGRWLADVAVTNADRFRTDSPPAP